MVFQIRCWDSNFLSARRLLNSEAARPLNAGVLLRRHGRHLTLNAITAAKRLVADLERLKAGTIAASALMASPVLDQWTHSFRKVACLEGVVEGKPSLSSGPLISTSEVYAHYREDDKDFVSALNHWYRLGSQGNRAILDTGAAAADFGGDADADS